MVQILGFNASDSWEVWAYTPTLCEGGIHLESDFHLYQLSSVSKFHLSGLDSTSTDYSIITWSLSMANVMLS